MSLKISRLLHAGYLFEGGGARVLFDPVFENPFSRNCYAFPDVSFDTSALRSLNPDAVFISHYHDDHCSFESLDFIDRKTPIYMFCVFEEMFGLIRELGFERVYSLELGRGVTIGEMRITARRALDADVDSIFHVECAGLNVLNVVDSWIDSLMLEELGPVKWDLVLWPFQTMREIEVIAPRSAGPATEELPPEWNEQLRLLNPRFLVPSSCQFTFESWSWHRFAFFPVSYAFFAKAMRKILPETAILKLNPGSSFLLHKNSGEFMKPLSWIRITGNPDADYEFNPQLQPQSIREIAGYFPALGAADKKRVLDYIRHGLPEKYRSLDEPLEPYFAKPRLWKLRLWNSSGEPADFYFRVHGAGIESAEASGEFDWLTEIPEARLYGALEEGETLTSLYVRVNDAPFRAEIETLIRDTDVVDDPLIRCLYSGVFGAYQKAQLRRLKGI